MIHYVFSLYDNKAQFFSPPWFFPHPGQAIRTVIDIGGDRSTLPGKYPEDFILFRIGTFNDSTGVYEGEPPLNLGTVGSLLPRAPGRFDPLADDKGDA